jgi:hypothetical protein
MKASLEGLMPDGLSRLAHYNLAVCEREKGLDADAPPLRGGGPGAPVGSRSWAQAVVLETRRRSGRAGAGSGAGSGADGQRMTGGDLLGHLRLHVRAGSADAELLEV